MASEGKKSGRTRVLSDKERIDYNREKSKRCIRVLTPDGFKEDLQKFVQSKTGESVSDYVFKLINNNKDFKEFRKASNG